MDFGIDNGLYDEALASNIFGKKSADGVQKTGNYLKSLYDFDEKNAFFIALKHFWKLVETNERPLLALLYAINNDNLLAESIEVLKQTKHGDKATIEKFEETIERYHPNKYSNNTRRSMAQNIASSWKQAGFILGKVKNIRVVPNISYRVAGFAFLLAYLKGERGDFIWNSTGVSALCLYESKLRELAVECARKDLMQYQFAGSVTSIGFSNLLNKIGIHAI